MHERLAAAIRRRGNTWRRWQPLVKMSGYCPDIARGLWIQDDEGDSALWDTFSAGPCPGCTGCGGTGYARTEIPVVSQREYECGSHQCGENTSRGLRRFGNLSCVFLDQHGPNIVFHRSIDPTEVIDFIEKNFDLSAKTGGYV